MIQFTTKLADKFLNRLVLKRLMIYKPEEVYPQNKIKEIDDLQTYLQDLVNQRKQIFKITKITNDLGIKLK